MRKLFMLVVLGLFVFAACGKKEASATSGGKKHLVS